VLCAAVASPAHALKVVTWNLWGYPANSLAVRQPNFRTVIDALRPDLIIAQEINSTAGRDSFLNNVLNVVEPGQWSGLWISLQPSPVEGGAVFWKPAKVSVSNFGAFGTSGPRDVMQCLVRPAGYGTSTSFRLYSIHLKAGNPSSSPADSTTRRLECTDIRTQINTAPAGTHFLIGGDANFYGAWEGGYARLTESQLDNDGRGKDPLNLPGTWNTNSSYAVHHTQCPCLSGCISGFSGGGLDDRFDLFLTSYNLQDGEGLDLVPSTYAAYGNDGVHFNNDINGDGFNFAVGYTVATALKNASDHIPVVLQIQVPAQVLAASSLDFRVIEGAVAQQALTVSNRAAVPADELTYSLVVPPGDFTAPSGPFTADAGAAGNAHVVEMEASYPGPRSGSLTVTSDDPDSSNKLVLLTGNVLRHAEPSLDSLAAQTARTIDFGDRAIPYFADTTVRVHNRGWDADQAQLSVTAAEIAGGGGRFSIADFAPALLGAPRSWTVRFDSFGATLDSTYEAMLTLTTADEPLPGATALAPLAVTLRARPVSGVADAGDGLPRAVRFLPARPNPLSDATTFAFELPRAAEVSLEVYDLGGRLVDAPAAGAYGAGRHEVRWQARSESGGRVPGGLYFARFRAAGVDRIERVIVLP
jgi:endonuclease/exonuclease/phosphatase family metal-dependent hydrolase